MSEHTTPPGASDPGRAPGEEPEVGSVAEEAAALFAALGDWAKEHGGQYAGAAEGAARAAKDAVRDAEAHVATGDEDCRFCPLCQVIHAVRETSPEVKSHLLVAANSLVQAAAGMLATRVPEERSGVEHIDLDEEEE